MAYISNTGNGCIGEVVQQEPTEHKARGNRNPHADGHSMAILTANRSSIRATEVTTPSTCTDSPPCLQASSTRPRCRLTYLPAATQQPPPLMHPEPTWPVDVQLPGKRPAPSTHTQCQGHQNGVQHCQCNQNGGGLAPSADGDAIRSEGIVCGVTGGHDQGHPADMVALSCMFSCAAGMCNMVFACRAMCAGQRPVPGVLLGD